MNRTNRIEPVHIETSPMKYAVMTITTQMDILRQVEVTPLNEEMTQQYSHIRSKTTERSRKTLSLVTCLFTTAAIIALSIFMIGLIIAFAKTKTRKENAIERYDLGDLQYGLNNINQLNFSSHTHLSDINTILVQKYFSDRLLNESGYRGLVMDGVFLQNQLLKNQRKQRDTSCSIVFIIQNLQIYFDQCSSCVNKRQQALHRSFFNLKTFQQPLHLIINNFNVYPQICSTPYPSRSIVPNRLSNSHLSSNNTSYKSNLQNTLLRNTTALMHQSERITKPSSSSTNNSIKTTTKSSKVTITQRNPHQKSNPISTKSVVSRQQSKITPKTSVRSTVPEMFQFLPFRPSTSYFSQHNTLFNRQSNNS
ncbi:hypothetical protein I4U23_025570 [Adineta vaga]|nr:hypothetical protein I4U23_025570 [Adineta vaga]